jgi:hypothetical protein
MITFVIWYILPMRRTAGQDKTESGQLELPLGLLDEAALGDYLSRRAGRPVRLTVTDNSTSVLSVRAKGRTLQVRAHWMFLRAGEDVLSEMAGFVRTRSGRTPLVRQFIRQNMGCLRERPAPKVTLRPGGRFHDLADVFRRLNEEYFEGAVCASVTWGTGGARRAARKRTLGSYSPSTGIIRINPALDRRGVPRYFVAFVLYHEMLHVRMGVCKGRVHTAEFRRRERMFRDYARAMAWEKKTWG